MVVKNTENIATDSILVSRENPYRSTDLSASVVKLQELTDSHVEIMYALYSEHYAETEQEKFVKDLYDKTHIFLLNNSEGELCGFSTLELYESSFCGQRIMVAFSGDTIIVPKYWGSNALAFEWLRFMGRIKKRDPDLALYWLLIVKGHRTYRYLSAFALRYTPHHMQAPSSYQTKLLNTLASQKFGSCFDANTGIARFGPHSGRLNTCLAQIPAAHSKRAAVRYFLERNPGYKHGDELVCLCELSDCNMRPLARRVFLAI